MIPPFAHGTRTRWELRPGDAVLVSDVTRAVMEPFPVSAWCTK
jgi:hypothetical protein